MFYSCATPAPAESGKTTRVAKLLLPKNQEITEGWVLARAGFGADGPLEIRLLNEYGSPVSDVVEVRSTDSARHKFTQVNVPADGFPPVVIVEVKNTASANNPNPGFIDGLLLS